MNNLDYFKLSLQTGENISSDLYRIDKIIITKDANQTNELIEANKKILKNITAYEIASGKEGEKIRNKIIKNIISLLETPGINHSEFTNYWCTHDVSFSLYGGFSDKYKNEFIKNMIESYIQNRHEMYLSHGYTNSTLQVRCDSIAHKSKGKAGCLKVEKILEKNGIKYFGENDLENFLDPNNKFYILPDGKSKNLFLEIIRNKIIKFKWSGSHQGKLPDLFINLCGKYIVVEHKHMNESGGGQNKQIAEVIDFIKYGENNLSYAVFLDGIFFDKFANELQEGKLKNQYSSIIKYLKNNPQNYFVNTVGFERYIEDLEKNKQ